MLYLIPNFLSKSSREPKWLPAILHDIVPALDGLIAESMQGGLSFLKKYPTKVKPHHLPIALLNEHTKEDEIPFLLEPLEKGETWGLVSDAGIPCVADPGYPLVALARKKKIPVKAIPGPSSIYLSLMLSGLPSQRFAFHGYIPKDPERKAKVLLDLEKRSKQDRATQIFIEAPYRNKSTFDLILSTCKPTTSLCIAKDLLGDEETVHTARLSEWKNSTPINFDKTPMIFLLYT